MPVPEHWSHAGWVRDDKWRLQLTLAISITLHAVLLFAWKLPSELRKVTEHQILTVILRGATAVDSGAKPLAQEREVTILVRKSVQSPSFSVPSKPEVRTPAAVVSNRPQPAAPGRQGQLADQSSPGRASNSSPAPVGVAVLLVIGSDGRVTQIFWNKLPALTNEQFHRVEAAIQAKSYAPGQTVSEVFDVREFLKLPPVPVGESEMATASGRSE